MSIPETRGSCVEVSIDNQLITVHGLNGAHERFSAGQFTDPDFARPREYGFSGFVSGYLRALPALWLLHQVKNSFFRCRQQFRKRLGLPMDQLEIMRHVQ